MQFYISQLLKRILFFSPAGMKTEFRSHRRNRNRGRVATHDNRPFLLSKFESCSRSRPARPRSSIRRAALATLFVCALIFAASAFVQEAPATIPVHNTPPTRIEVDQQANIIRFFIDGEESMRLDPNGLHIKDNQTYGGMIVDVGKTGYPGGGMFGGADAE